MAERDDIEHTIVAVSFFPTGRPYRVDLQKKLRNAGAHDASPFQEANRLTLRRFHLNACVLRFHLNALKQCGPAWMSTVDQF